MRTGWQWKHGSFESDLYATQDEVLYWAERASTGGADDDIAIREVTFGEWQAVDHRGLVSEQKPAKELLAEMRAERDARIRDGGKG